MTSEGIEEKRLWIGHLDTRISEFQLLKILQQFGRIDKFDMLFHKSGPLFGQPRGYAFATYNTPEEAKIALKKLHGQQIGIKHCSVRFAKNVNYDELIDKYQKPKIEIPALAAGGSKEGQSATKLSKEITIQAIEAKLKLLENKKTGDDFVVNKTVNHEPGIIQRYQYNANNPNQDRQNANKYVKRKYQKTRPSGPYNRPNRR